MSATSQLESMLKSLDNELEHMEFLNPELIERAHLARRILNDSVDAATREKIGELLTAQSDGQPRASMEVVPVNVEAAQSRHAKMTDAAWSMRTRSQRFADPELKQYDGKHIAVFEMRIVASGDNYTKVLERAMAECGVPYHRIVMDYWGNLSRLQSIPDGDDV